MITTLVGIQAVCVSITVYLTLKSTKRTSAMKIVARDKKTGFKHFKAGGF